MRKRIALLTLILIATVISARSFAQAIADTPENRQQQADRYLQATPPKELFTTMAQKMAMNLPPSERDKFIKTFASEIDMDAVIKAMRTAIIKHFTAEEIKALADFYGSPVGKSAMSKFGDYMADVMPALQAEVMKAQAKINQTLPNQ
jgi:hypothetical protein